MEEEAIARLVSPIKQLKIIKEDQNVFSVVQFEALPNEVILHVFSYLKIVDLLKCGQVSKRFRAISNDDQYLWPKKFNLCYKKVPVGFLERLLENGCKYLSLSEAVLEGTLYLPKASKLQYLNISGFELERYKKNSEKLIESCYSLQKLSLSKCKLSSELISITSLQNGKSLKVLDLSKCTFFGSHFLEGSRKCELDCIQQVVENCTELKELSLYKTDLNERSIDFLVSYLTSNIEKLDLFDQSFLRYTHVKKLVTRCHKITELNLGGLNSITRMTYFQVTGDWNNFVDYSGLKNQLQNLKITASPGNSRIATPCHQGYSNFHGIWDIKAEREKLFMSFVADQNPELFSESKGGGMLRF